MKRILAALLIIAPLAALAAWTGQQTDSDGTTPVTIVSAPASGYNRVVAANGGIKVYSASNVTFNVYWVNGNVTNTMDKVTIPSNSVWVADYVTVLSTTTNSLQLVGTTAFGSALKVLTHWRDESQ